jgi:hypothetical protein
MREALDAVSEALRTIYDAKRNRTATAKDDLRLKKLHVEWMAIIRKIGGGEGEDPSPPRGADLNGASVLIDRAPRRGGTMLVVS